MLSRSEYEEVLQMRRELAYLRVDLNRTVRAYYARKYSPNQLRVPAGSREGGQWTSDGAAAAKLQPHKVIPVAGQSAAYCWNQMLVDMLLCGSLKPAWYRAACRGQANARYGACLAGSPIPPLPF